MASKGFPDLGSKAEIVCGGAGDSSYHQNQGPSLPLGDARRRHGTQLTSVSHEDPRQTSSEAGSTTGEACLP